MGQLHPSTINVLAFLCTLIRCTCHIFDVFTHLTHITGSDSKVLFERMWFSWWLSSISCAWYSLSSYMSQEPICERFFVLTFNLIHIFRSSEVLLFSLGSLWPCKSAQICLDDRYLIYSMFSWSVYSTWRNGRTAYFVNHIIGSPSPCDFHLPHSYFRIRAAYEVIIISPLGMVCGLICSAGIVDIYPRSQCCRHVFLCLLYI